MGEGGWLDARRERASERERASVRTCVRAERVCYFRRGKCCMRVSCLHYINRQWYTREMRLETHNSSLCTVSLVPRRARGTRGETQSYRQSFVSRRELCNITSSLASKAIMSPFHPPALSCPILVFLTRYFDSSRTFAAKSLTGS